MTDPSEIDVDNCYYGSLNIEEDAKVWVFQLQLSETEKLQSDEFEFCTLTFYFMDRSLMMKKYNMGFLNYQERKEMENFILDTLFFNKKEYTLE